MVGSFLGGGVVPHTPPTHNFKYFFKYAMKSLETLQGSCANLLELTQTISTSEKSRNQIIKVDQNNFYWNIPYFLGYFHVTFGGWQKKKFSASLFSVFQASQLSFNEFKSLEETLFLLFWSRELTSLVPVDLKLYLKTSWQIFRIFVDTTILTTTFTKKNRSGD